MRRDPALYVRGVDYLFDVQCDISHEIIVTFLRLFKVVRRRGGPFSRVLQLGL